jgi:serine/threonine-protein kinase
VKTWSPGDEIAGRYRLIEPIGEGGMGRVFRAEHLTLGSDVAIKLLRPTDEAGDVRRRRFVREARTAAALRGAHVVQILDHGVTEGTPFIVMELLRGDSLRARLTRDGHLSPAELGRVLVHVARALSRAHARGVVHRDLKPENVFLVDEEGMPSVKVLDFGVAKVQEKWAEASRVTASGAILGTPSYMSPEQLRGRNVDAAADLWSLATIAFECLCGRQPFEGDSLADLIVNISTGPIPSPSSFAEVPDGFDDWFARGVHRQPRERFGSARELAEAYLALLPDVPSELSSWAAEPEALLAIEDEDVNIVIGSAQASPSADRRTLAETPSRDDVGATPSGRAPPIGRGRPAWLGSPGLVLAVALALVLGGLSLWLRDGLEAPRRTEQAGGSPPPLQEARTIAVSASSDRVLPPLVEAPQAVAASAATAQPRASRKPVGPSVARTAQPTRTAAPSALEPRDDLKKELAF